MTTINFRKTSCGGKVLLPHHGRNIHGVKSGTGIFRSPVIKHEEVKDASELKSIEQNKPTMNSVVSKLQDLKISSKRSGGLIKFSL